MASTIPHYQAAGNDTLRLVKTGFTHLSKAEVENPNTTHVVYIQFFDAAAIADVTLGSDTPIQTYQVNIGTGDGNNANGEESGVREIYFDQPLRFGLGLVWAVTREREGSTAPVVNCPVNLTFD